MKRVVFRNSDTGTSLRQSGPLTGKIAQLIVAPGSAADSGADISVTVLPSQDDTGHGYLIYSKANSGAVHRIEFPRGAVSVGTTGADNSGDTGYTEYCLAGDRVQVGVVQSGAVTAAFSGTVYLYLDDC